jgi:hypothetical protein
MTTRLPSFLRLMSALLLGCCLSAICLFTTAATGDDNYELLIRPSICVSFDNEEPCIMMLAISWAGGSGEPVCLNTATDASYITCWNDSFTGETEQPYENSGNVVYQLVSMQNNRILADAEVQVISRDLRDSRRRRRHVWSIL